MSRRGAVTRPSSSRPVPAAVLLLLAALAVALGPALGARSGSALSEALGSAARTAAGTAGLVAGTADPAGNQAELGRSDRTRRGIAGDERNGTTPAPSRAALRHPLGGPAGLERPTFDAVLPAIVVAGPLLVLIGAYALNARPPGLTLPRGSARSPPASLA